MDLYEVHKSNREIFQRLSLKDVLLIFYGCPQLKTTLSLYAKHTMFNFTISGKRIFHHGNNTWVTNTEKGILVKRCAFLQELPPKYEDWHVIAFYLKDDYLRLIFDEFRPHLNLSNLPNPNKEMIEVFYINDQIKANYISLKPYFTNEISLPDSILESKFKELLFNIFSHPENKHILSYILRIVDRYNTPIWEIMEANYMYDLKIQDFANISNRSTSTFKRDFKEYYKVSPGKWLTERRLNRAKSLLETTNSTINEVAFESGFKNSSHFSRIFKEKYQLSPSDFKKL